MAQSNLRLFDFAHCLDGAFTPGARRFVHFVYFSPFFR
jgi:hypothetical protein